MLVNLRAESSLKLNAEKQTLAKAVRVALCAGPTVIMLSIAPFAYSQGNFESTLELSDLDGSDGFVINGIIGGDRSGYSVSSAGDVNGDRLDDLLIGAPDANPNGENGAGESYVVFGDEALGTNGAIELRGLDGSDGFVINGINSGDGSGAAVSGAGDVNGDGISDLIIGAEYADPNGKGEAGESYVVFGAGGVGSTGAIDLSELDGSDGFVIKGIDANDRSGVSVSSVGDINGDNVDDLIIGARFARPNGNATAGESYVLFGSGVLGTSGSVELSDLDGSDGFVINGIDVDDRSGKAVSGAGDVNGDGLDDLIIGAYLADPNGGFTTGESYVVFGSGGVGNTGAIQLSSLDGSNGFVINGIDGFDNSGNSVSAAGDINADGLDDLIIGAYRADPNNDGQAGESYVLFGSNTVGNLGAIELFGLDGSNGFVINGIDSNDRSGRSVSGAGDINGDDVDDLIIGAEGADSNGSNYSGESYMLFGGVNVGNGGVVELSNLDGSDGVTINGADVGDRSGFSVSGVGDVNGDGADDVIIGAYLADPIGKSAAGESYVIFGKATTLLCNGLPVTVDLNLGQTPGPGDDVVMGTPGNDDIRGRAGNDTICGMGGDDFLHGNSGDDWIDGGDGVDDIRGGNGDDTLFAGSGATVGNSSRVFGGVGVDAIFGGPDADDLRGGRGDDVISGEGGADMIAGNADNDTLFGGPGADDIRGGSGDNDELFGEGGGDSLNGGFGGNDFCDGGGQGGDTDTNCEIF